MKKILNGITWALIGVETVVAIGIGVAMRKRSKQIAKEHGYDTPEEYLQAVSEGKAEDIIVEAEAKEV